MSEKNPHRNIYKSRNREGRKNKGAGFRVIMHRRGVSDTKENELVKRRKVEVERTRARTKRQPVQPALPGRRETRGRLSSRKKRTQNKKERTTEKKKKKMNPYTRIAGRTALRNQKKNSTNPKATVCKTASNRVDTTKKTIFCRLFQKRRVLRGASFWTVPGWLHTFCEKNRQAANKEKNILDHNCS